MTTQPQPERPDLAAWLLEQIEEDKADAQACHGHAWKHGPDGDGWAIELDLGQGPDETWGACVTCNDSGGNELGEAEVRHIARHDPARVLAECEAKRKIVEYEDRHEREVWRRGIDEHHQTFAEWQAVLGPPTVLRLLAQPYADRDGYDPAWSVQ